MKVGGKTHTAQITTTSFPLPPRVRDHPPLSTSLASSLFLTNRSNAGINHALTSGAISSPPTRATTKGDSGSSMNCRNAGIVCGDWRAGREGVIGGKDAWVVILFGCWWFGGWQEEEGEGRIRHVRRSQGTRFGRRRLSARGNPKLTKRAKMTLELGIAV